MTDKARKFISGPLMPVAVLAAVLVISLILFLFLGRDRDGRVFFFPTNSGAELGSERRGIVAGDDTRDKVEIFLEELFLGPETLAYTYTVPRGTGVRHVAIVEKTVYVDLTSRILDIPGELPISMDEALSNLQYNILYNFPRLEDVVFTIEGSQVNAPYYSQTETLE